MYNVGHRVRKLQHVGVTVYCVMHAWNEGVELQYWYSMEPGVLSEGPTAHKAFDVRKLPAWTTPPAMPQHSGFDSPEMRMWRLACADHVLDVLCAAIHDRSIFTAAEVQRAAR